MKTVTLTQARQTQDIAHRLIVKLGQDMERVDVATERIEIAKALSLATRAWHLACERCRIVRGSPLPGSFRPTAKEKRAAAGAAGKPVEPRPVGVTGQGWDDLDDPPETEVPTTPEGPSAPPVPPGWRQVTTGNIEPNDRWWKPGQAEWRPTNPTATGKIESWCQQGFRCIRQAA